MLTTRAARHATDIHCARKRRYQDVLAAAATAIHNMRNTGVKRLRIYFCQSCLGFHLTRKKGNTLTINRDDHFTREELGLPVKREKGGSV
jgi:hypothetical protein